MKGYGRVFLAVGLLALFVGVLALGLEAATVEGTFERTLNVTGAVSLDVATGSGDITVRGAEPGRVHIVGRYRIRDTWLGLSAEERAQLLKDNPPIQQDGNRIRVGHIEDRRLRRNVSISYEILTPSETSLDASTGSGSQEISGIQGPVEASCGSGNISLARIPRDVDVNTGSGNITLDEIGGSVEARTGSGNIHISSAGAAVNARTGSGRVEVGQAGEKVEVSTGSGSISLGGVTRDLRARSGSGSIRVEGNPAAQSLWDIRASSGDITLTVPSSANFELYAHTSSGSIETRHPMTVTGKLRRGELRATLNRADARVEVHTSSGDIRID